MSRFIIILSYEKSMSTPDTTRESMLDRINEYIEMLMWTFKQVPMDDKTKKFCFEHLKKLQWEDTSKIYVKYGKTQLSLLNYILN